MACSSGKLRIVRLLRCHTSAGYHEKSSEQEDAMFKIGDYVAHYKEGVCEVVNIGKIDMGSSDKEYYTLKPVYDAGGTVYTPVDNKRGQIRNLITKEEAEKLIQEMPEIDTIGVTNEKEREGMYKNALLHNQCKEWISLLKTSYGRNKKRLLEGKKTINIDERYMSVAEKFLYGELAVVLEIPRDKVDRYVKEHLDAGMA